MPVVLHHRPRLSARQAIVVHYSAHVPDWATAYVLPTLLDLLGTVVAVNGVTTIVTCDSRESRRMLSEALPAGIELLQSTDGDSAHWPLDDLAVRGFDRVAVLAGDTLAVPVRLLSTALSTVGAEGEVVGLTPGDIPYLYGVRTELLEQAPRLDLLQHIKAGRTGVEVAPTRGLERMTRLCEFESTTEIQEYLAGSEQLNPRLLHELEKHS